MSDKICHVLFQSKVTKRWTRTPRDGGPSPRTHSPLVAELNLEHKSWNSDRYLGPLFVCFFSHPPATPIPHRRQGCVLISDCEHVQYPNLGVPVVAQWLTNPTGNHEIETNPTRNHKIAGSIPGLTRWVMDLALP